MMTKQTTKKRKIQKKKQIPVLYIDKEECCGCSACYAICPVMAISMQEDKEGFFYPVIDSNLCIQCYQCVNICVFKDRTEK